MLFIHRDLLQKIFTLICFEITLGFGHATLVDVTRWSSQLRQNSAFFRITPPMGGTDNYQMNNYSKKEKVVVLDTKGWSNFVINHNIISNPISQIIFFTHTNALSNFMFWTYWKVSI